MNSQPDKDKAADEAFNASRPFLKADESERVKGQLSYQRHLNQSQADTIETFLAFDGGDRKQLCDEIRCVAKDKVERYWRDGAHDALEELRNRELYSRSYNNGMKR